MNKNNITKIFLKKKIIQLKLFNILMIILYDFIKSLNSNDFEVIYPGFTPKNLKT